MLIDIAIVKADVKKAAQHFAMQIVTAYMAKEEGAYMRDYVMDQNGRLESLTFTDVDELNVDKFGLSVLTP